MLQVYEFHCFTENQSRMNIDENIYEADEKCEMCQMCQKRHRKINKYSKENVNKYLIIHT